MTHSKYVNGKMVAINHNTVWVNGEPFVYPNATIAHNQYNRLLRYRARMFK